MVEDKTKATKDPFQPKKQHSLVQIRKDNWCGMQYLSKWLSKMGHPFASKLADVSHMRIFCCQARVTRMRRRVSDKDCNGGPATTIQQQTA